MGLLGGLAADLMLRWPWPTERRRVPRVLAFTTPVALFALYFLILGITEGLSWPPTLWLGAILEAGVIGLLLSYLAVPPPAGPCLAPAS